MTAQDLFRCIGNLSDTMIEEAADIRRKKRWLPIAALAACAVLAISIPLAVRNLGYKNADNASQAAGVRESQTQIILHIRAAGGIIEPADLPHAVLALNFSRVVGTVRLAEHGPHVLTLHPQPQSAELRPATCSC